jgi:hypothetical protein
MSMQPLTALARDTCRNLVGVLADIDDTLTTEGRIGADAFDALEKLRAAGLLVIPVTGRPAGWCDMIARAFPVDAVVGENGAFAFRYDEAAKRVARIYAADAATRAANRRRLNALGPRILAAVPGAGIASDQAFREADLAIDVCEDVPRLPEAAIERIVALFCAEGATAKLSSIHVNGWFGTYDKLSMTRRLLREAFGHDIDGPAKSRFVFVGDSPNDAPMFAFFPNAIGVANVVEFADRCEALPAYVTRARCSAGFAEAARHVLSQRG